MSPQEKWQQVNRELIAKSIGELAYEQILQPYSLSNLPNPAKRPFVLELKSGVKYQFEAWLSVWDHLRVTAGSIMRISKDGSVALGAGQFFIDAQKDLEMTDIILAQFLEEMQATLFSDVILLEKNQNLTAEEIATWDGNKVQTILNGHPKILLNKGRIGWGVSALEKFSPESDQAFQLHWVAVLKSKIVLGLGPSEDLNSSYLQCLSQDQINTFCAKLKKFEKDADDYVYMPVHPWQWDRWIQSHFASEIYAGTLIHLGPAGDLYKPQISIRTLVNVTRPECDDIKLPLSILNTSAVRGIPERYIRSAPLVSQALQDICDNDIFLKQSETQVLNEKAGVSVQHSLYAQIEKSPYRYNEMLGAIWRESVQSKLGPNESAILTGSLFHQDLQGRSLIGAYIKKSGLSADDWLKRYFDVSVIPLYHLQLKYGLGLVAHGQNIVLKLTNFVPTGIFLKDFQGDLRISTTHTLKNSSLNNLDQLPPHYLIHDLVTGHFITVLRFVSETLHECDQISERDFYNILADRIQNYILQNKEQVVSSELDLLSETIQRVLLNKVRFKIGYADSSERPLPLLGTALKNPLHRSRVGENNG